MNDDSESLEMEELETVFEGTGDSSVEMAACKDECVGGTANTKAMEATIP